LGSTLALADDAGTVQSTYTYEPFGTSVATGQNNPNTFQYTGRENDGTGLYYYRARYYSPSHQRFISEDPIGFRGGGVKLHSYLLGKTIQLIYPQSPDAKGSYYPNFPTPLGIAGNDNPNVCFFSPPSF